MKTLLCCLAAFCLLCDEIAAADEVRVAAASNFRETLAALAAAFEAGSAHELVLIFGSSGKHYAQIVNGAPFDVFLSADAERPERLENAGLSLHGSRFTYALGRLALWSAQPALVDQGGAVLKRGDWHYLAIANPDLAPYGRAAVEVLHRAGAWEAARQRLVRGENVAQAFQFVDSGSAEMGFVAWPQLVTAQRSEEGSHWLVPESMHRPIVQQAVLLSDSQGARDFHAWLQSDEARQLIRAHGYGIP